MSDEASPAGRRPTAADDELVEIEITPDGYLRLPAAFAQAHFEHDRCIGVEKETEFILWPATVYTDTAIMMKQRNLQGDRSTLIREIWGDGYPVGSFTARWQATRRRLVLNKPNAEEPA